MSDSGSADRRPGQDPDADRLAEAFEALLDADPGEREALLARVRGESPALGRELAALWAAHQRRGILDEPRLPLDDLEPPQHEKRRPTPSPVRPPERIGPYRVVEELGRGGMGVVYLADRDDGQFFRRVAIKVIGGTDPSADLEARFEAERQILANLDHPGIARLYDGGVTEDGRPYLVMEYVRGLPIDEYCRRRDVDLADRIRLFCRAARAVHHAHRRLVVHRDLKPTNILVTERGEVKLLDFGIAKILDPAVVGGVAPRTRTGFHLMTPEYAAPEQVLGEPITTATDVYGLGVVLFEILTGRRPFELRGKAPAEWARMIVHEAPEAPSEVAEPYVPAAEDPPELDAWRVAARDERQRLRRRLRGDLDRITLTSLRKEPDRRYGSAARLAEDLERHLEGLPIEARADSAGYRLRKYVYRNRFAVGAAVVVAFSLLGGTAAAVTQARRATRQAELAAAQRDLMMELFRLSDPTETLGDTLTARELLDRGTERIEREFGSDPRMKAAMLAEVADVYANLGLLERAGKLADEALGLRSEHLRPRDPELSASWAQVGRLRAELGDRDAAIEYLRRALELRRTALRDPDSLLARIQSDLAWQLRAAGRHDEAAALFAEALRLQSALLGDAHPDAASTLFGLAAAHHDAGRFDEAEAAFGRALARYDTARSRPRPEVAQALLNIAMIRRLRGRPAEAEPLAASAVAMREKLFDAAHPEVIEALTEWGTNLRDEGRYAEAEGVLRDALGRSAGTLGPEHAATLTLRERLGTVLTALGRYEAAAAQIDTAVAVKRARLSPDDANLIMALVRAGEPRLLAGRLADAAALFTEAQGGTGPGSVYRIVTTGALAKVALARGEGTTADSLLTVALHLAAEKLRPGHRYTQGLEVTRAELDLRRGRATGAAAELGSIVEARAEALGELHPGTGKARHVLGEALLAAGDAAGAEAELRKALAAYAALPPSHWQAGDATSLLGASLVAQGRTAEGRRLLREGHATVTRHLGADSPLTARTAARMTAAGG